MTPWASRALVRTQNGHFGWGVMNSDRELSASGISLWFKLSSFTRKCVNWPHLLKAFRNTGNLNCNQRFGFRRWILLFWQHCCSIVCKQTGLFWASFQKINHLTAWQIDSATTTSQPWWNPIITFTYFDRSGGVWLFCGQINPITKSSSRADFARSQLEWFLYFC